MNRVNVLEINDANGYRQMSIRGGMHIPAGYLHVIDIPGSFTIQLNDYRILRRFTPLTRKGLGRKVYPGVIGPARDHVMSFAEISTDCIRFRSGYILNSCG